MSPRSISEEVQSRVRAQANNRCGYCRSLQKYVLGKLEIEHTIPKVAGGTDDFDKPGSRLAGILHQNRKLKLVHLQHFRKEAVPLLWQVLEHGSATVAFEASNPSCAMLGGCCGIILM